MKRFSFGKNWRSFVGVLTDERIEIALRSLREMLGVEGLRGKTFLDIGCGSGLFSLCARKLGASVISFDFDPDSVACAKGLRDQHFPGDEAWQIEQGSVLDENYMRGFGLHDVVYAWGVLHHTGDMRSAMEHAGRCVKPGGTLFVALYNDQGYRSKVWLRVKQAYCSGWWGRSLVKAVHIPFFVFLGLKEDLVRFRNPFNRYREYKRSRGMSIYHDWIDWLGGLPFEVAKPDEVVDFYVARGFVLIRIRSAGGSLGNNQFVFRKLAEG